MAPHPAEEKTRPGEWFWPQRLQPGGKEKKPESPSPLVNAVYTKGGGFVEQKGPVAPLSNCLYKTIAKLRFACFLERLLCGRPL